MKTNDELIQDYLDEVLEDADKIRFKELLKENIEFQQELALQKELRNNLKNRLSADATALREKLIIAEMNMRKNPSQSMQLRKWTPYLAAACLLIAGALFFFPTSDNNIYNLPDMRSEIVRGNASGEIHRYEEAVLAFNTHDYGRSSTILRELFSMDPEVLQYQYYLGLSLIGENKMEAAVTQLRALAEGTSVYQQESKYYLAFALHHSGKNQEAKNWLNQIPSNVKIYEEAQTLLKKIK